MPGMLMVNFVRFLVFIVRLVYAIVRVEVPRASYRLLALQ